MEPVQGPREQCPACGDPLPIPRPETEIVASGGWCAPVDLLYDMPRSPRICGACLAAKALGISREAMDAIIAPMPRGGITFNTGAKR